MRGEHSHVAVKRSDGAVVVVAGQTTTVGYRRPVALSRELADEGQTRWNKGYPTDMLGCKCGGYVNDPSCVSSGRHVPRRPGGIHMLAQNERWGHHAKLTSNDTVIIRSFQRA